MASCVTVSCLFASLLTGRLIEDWPYEKLFKQADLIVIVKPLDNRDANAQDEVKPLQDYLTGVVTNFKVLHVVKGDYKKEKLEIVHFRMKDGMKVINGPMLVSFQTKEVTLRAEDRKIAIKAWEYMLFLKKEKDGCMNFVSGQFDPALSVKQMMNPWLGIKD